MRPAVRPKAASLQPQGNPFRHRRPDSPVVLQERVDLVVRQVEPLVTPREERLERPVDEALPEIFVREQTANQQVNGFLRHTSMPGNLRAS